MYNILYIIALAVVIIVLRGQFKLINVMVNDREHSTSTGVRSGGGGAVAHHVYGKDHTSPVTDSCLLC